MAHFRKWALHGVGKTQSAHVQKRIVGAGNPRAQAGVPVPRTVRQAARVEEWKRTQEHRQECLCHWEAARLKGELWR